MALSMLCPECGSKVELVNGSFGFCPRCGTRVDKDISDTASATADVSATAGDTASPAKPTAQSASRQAEPKTTPACATEDELDEDEIFSRLTELTEAIEHSKKTALQVSEKAGLRMGICAFIIVLNIQWTIRMLKNCYSIIVICIFILIALAVSIALVVGIVRCFKKTKEAKSICDSKEEELYAYDKQMSVHKGYRRIRTEFDSYHQAENRKY